MALAEVLACHRAALDLTYRQLADRTSEHGSRVDPAKLCRLEVGETGREVRPRVSAAEILALSAALQLPPEGSRELLTGANMTAAEFAAAAAALGIPADEWPGILGAVDGQAA